MSGAACERKAAMWRRASEPAKWRSECEMGVAS